MPVEFVGLITVEHFYALSGLSGIFCSYIILKFWGAGL